jgi:Gas vesicle synthesis protein GvpL/GvpF
MRAPANRERLRDAGAIYVYALVDRKLPRMRINGRTIESVAADDVFALAERTDRTPPISEEGLREQHDIILKLAERAPAILPARFGSLVAEEELQKIVALRAVQLHTAFDLVRGRQQMTVRLIGATETARRSRSHNATVVSGHGARYLAERRRAAGYPLPDAVLRLNAAVRSMVFAEKSEPGRGGVRAMVYHLIERGQSADYSRRLARVAADVEPFAVAVSGPFPPFAFAPELLG